MGASNTDEHRWVFFSTYRRIPSGLSQQRSSRSSSHFFPPFRFSRSLYRSWKPKQQQVIIKISVSYVWKRFPRVCLVVTCILEFPRISRIRNTFLHRISHYLKRHTRKTMKWQKMLLINIIALQLTLKVAPLLVLLVARQYGKCWPCYCGHICFFPSIVSSVSHQVFSRLIIDLNVWI